MAEYYSSEIGPSKRGGDDKRRSGKELALLVLDIAMGVVMCVLLFLSLTAIVCQYVSPERSGVLSVVALGAPIIYLLDVVLMFYWLVRTRWIMAIIMSVMVVTGFFYVSKYYNLSIDREYDVKYKESRYTKVMTYNVREGHDSKLVDYIESHKPNILCLQEITTNTDHWKTLTERYKNTYAAYTESPNQILTTYKIVRSGEIPGLPTITGLWADLLVNKDTVRVVNIHLQSTAIRVEDTRFLESHDYLVDKQRDTKLKSIVGRLVQNNKSRAVQARKVAEFLKTSPYKLVVCGDFNDVPLSYTYRTISKNLNDCFSEKARGFAYTFDTRYKLLRIDNILVSPAIEVVSYDVDNDIKLSDHYPVISRLNLTHK